MAPRPTEEKSPDEHTGIENLDSNDHATACSIETTNSTSRLLRLPAEIRSEIWTLAILRNFSIDILDNRRPNEPSRCAAQPALARTSRQIRREVLPMFYGGNTFEIDCSRYSRYLRPGKVLLNLEEQEFLGTMGRNREILQSFETVRRWLQMLGPRNRKWLGEVLVCCAEEDAGQLWETAMIRFDFGNQCLTCERAFPLLEGSEWRGKAQADDTTCFANVRYGAGLKHFSIATTG